MPRAKQLTAIGLMSGTSIDGIDAAIVTSDGEAVERAGVSVAHPYTDETRGVLREAMDRFAAAGDPVAMRAQYREFEEHLAALNGEAVGALLEKAGLAPGDIDVIGYHGQTVLHRPGAGLTVQLGDGAALARATGIRVVNDFRAADMVAGGEGAPFAPAYHRALSLGSGERAQVVVNIGGVANVTLLEGDADPVAFDTGPGNAMIDDFVMARAGRTHDEGGALALAGRVDETALAGLLSQPYFDRKPPKSLDRNDFPATPVEKLSLEDGAATLVAFTARTIAMATRFFTATPERWVVCGGGRHNAAIMAALARQTGGKVITAEDAGWRGDDIEAEAFAYLAVRSLKGLPLSWPTTTGVAAPQTGGVVHDPQAG